METKAVVRCAKCGGTNVQCLDWVYPNTGERVDGEAYCCDADLGETYCGDCEDNTPLVFYCASQKLGQLAQACGYADVDTFAEHHVDDLVAPGICIGSDCDVMALQVAEPRHCEACGYTTIIAANQL